MTCTISTSHKRNITLLLQGKDRATRRDLISRLLAWFRGDHLVLFLSTLREEIAATFICGAH
jgi:hypothetical protein